MPDIQSLTDRAHDLSQKVDWWNNAMLVALVVAAIAAALVVIFTRMVIVRGGQLADTQEEIIAAVNQKVGDANARAGQLERDAADLRKQVEEVKLARVKIEEKLAPRRLTVEQKTTIASKLRRFAGQKTFLRSYKGDTESIELAEDIFEALGSKGAGWDVSYLPIEPEQVGTDIISGILVGIFPAAGEKDKDAARSVVAAIRAERLDIGGPNALPAITEFFISHMKITPERHIDTSAPMVIQVGKKPN